MERQGEDDPSNAPHSRRLRQTLSWRPNVRLATVGTLVAVATGMVSLRNEILPARDDSLIASPGLYEQSVGDLCNGLNQAERARKHNAPRLARQLRGARTTVQQRNALLDSNNRMRVKAEHLLARFKGLEVPPGRRALHAKTTAAWEYSVGRLRGYGERLENSASRRKLIATLDTLPSMRRALAEYYVTRNAGLMKLAAGRCTREPESAIAVITLPATRGTGSAPGGGPDVPRSSGGGDGGPDVGSSGIEDDGEPDAGEFGGVPDADEFGGAPADEEVVP